jgi:N-methylhydantoinase B
MTTLEEPGTFGRNAATVDVRDIDSGEFAARYACDRFTAMVVASRLRYIIEHVCQGVLTSAFSLILRDWYDFAATLTAPPELDYLMPAVNEHSIYFIGTMMDAVRNTVEEFGPDNLRPGDVLVCNDPYRTGTHVNDTLFCRPVFRDGKVVTFVSIQAHMADMGGIVPAGFSGTKRNVYENGLVVGPNLLYRDERPVKSTWNFFFDNTRFGEIMAPDLITICESLKLGEQLVLETIDRYGLGVVFGAMRYACDAVESNLRRAIGQFPDGDYFGEGLIDCDGIDDSEEYVVKVKVSVRGERAEVDLSGTSRQARTSINCAWPDVKSIVAQCFKKLFDPRTSFTSGAFRPIDIILPEGTVVSALPPDGAIMLYWESSYALMSAFMKALSPALGAEAVGGEVLSFPLHNANGRREDGSTWISMAQTGGEHGAWGGSKVGDADSYNVNTAANSIDPPTESIEAEVPLVLARKEITIDTAGPGYHRGGAGILKDAIFLTDAEHYSMCLHMRDGYSHGVNGGFDSPNSGGVWIFEPEVVAPGGAPRLVGVGPDSYRASVPVAGILDEDTKRPDRVNGKLHYFARVPVWPTKRHAAFRYLTPGGGGWGDPFSREPERVLKDVRDEYVSIEGAARDYGVAVVGDPHHDPEGLRIDQDATFQLRSVGHSTPDGDPATG